MEINPYAPPQADLSVPQLSTNEDESIRQAHIKTEATVKSVGTLYYLGFFVLIASGVATLMANSSAAPEADSGVNLILSAAFIVIGVLQGVLAYGLRRLRSWSRWPTVVLSFIGLLAFPMGTLISALILSNTLGAKARMVFSEDYQRIIAATPQVKYKTSKVVVVLLVILVIILIGVIAAAFFA